MIKFIWVRVNSHKIVGTTIPTFKTIARQTSPTTYQILNGDTFISVDYSHITVLNDDPLISVSYNIPLSAFNEIGESLFLNDSLVNLSVAINT